MKFAMFARPVVTIYDLPETTKESDAGVVSTIGDEGLYGQVCQVRTEPGGVTEARGPGTSGCGVGASPSPSRAERPGSDIDSRPWGRLRARRCGGR